MSAGSLGSMHLFESDAHSFVIRLWREHAAEAQDDGWRGRIDHVQSGRRTYFQRLDDIPAIIRMVTAADLSDSVFEPLDAEDSHQ